jgi:hypothetical protein
MDQAARLATMQIAAANAVACEASGWATRRPKMTEAAIQCQRCGYR